MKLDLSYGDKKSNRYNIFKSLFQPHIESGLDQYTEGALPTLTGVKIRLIFFFHLIQMSL